jgi:hypothetical protein
MPAEHVRFDDSSTREQIRWGTARSFFRTFTFLALFQAIGSFGQSAPPDTVLSLQDKAQINKLAELQLQYFENVLQNIASLSTSSESDAQDLLGLVEAITESGDRIFYAPTTILEDNVDPDHKVGDVGIDRKASDYAVDFFHYFRADVNEAVDIVLLDRMEPFYQGNLVRTNILYEVTFRGHHKEKTTPYTTHRRLARFIAERRNSKDWSVFLAGDEYLKPGFMFESFTFEQQVKDAAASGDLTSSMRAFQAAEKAAADKAEQERADRRKKYTDEIARGDELMAAGDEELAIVMYDQAEKTDPLSTAHIIQKKKAQRQLLAKAKAAQSRALDSMAADLARQLESRGIRSVVVKEFKEENGFQSALGKNLTQQLIDRLAKSASDFKSCP